MQYESWFESYKPIDNEIIEDAPFEGKMFETYDDEVAFVSKQEPAHIWTLVEADDEMYIIAGWHFVDRMGYFITEKPFANPLIEVVVG